MTSSSSSSAAPPLSSSSSSSSISPFVEPFSQPALPDHPAVSPFLDPRSPLVITYLTFSKRAISVTAPRLWNDLPSELRTFSLPPPSSLQIIKHHLQHAPLSVTPGLSTRNSSPTSSRSLSLTHLIPFLPTPLLNYTRLNA